MTEFITSLDISLGSALLPKPLERHTGKKGTAISLAPPSGTPSYLWTARAPDADPVVDIQVLYDDEPTPPGYKKVARDLSGGASGKVFLAYKTAALNEAGSKGVAGIALLAEDETPDAGFTTLERPLVRTGPAIRLGLQLVAGDDSTEGTLSTWAENLKVGDHVDCLDKQRRWRVAKIAAVSSDGTKLTINFKGWASKHDEEIPRASKRLAKPGQHTAGKDTRANRRQGDAFDVDLEVLASLEMRIDDYMSGEFPPEEREMFAKGELPSYLEQVLSSKYESEELRDRINSFNQKVMELCVFHIKQTDVQLPPEVRQHLSRLFLDDHHCDYFFQHYGGIRPEHQLAATTNGWAARLPSGGASRYYVGNINHFYELGGYDAIVQRYEAINASSKTPSSASDEKEKEKEKDTKDDILEEARVFSSIVFIPRLCYTADWAVKYYQPLRDAVMNRVLTLTDAQLKRASRETIDSIRANFVRLGSELTRTYHTVAEEILAGPEGACSGDVLQSAIERWQMALAARLIRCDSLALRVKGVGDVREMVEAIDEATSGVSKSKHQNIRYVGGVMSYNAPAVTAVWFDEPKLVAWLKTYRVVDIVLGQRVDDSPVPAVHSQTVSRLPALVAFLARSDFRARIQRESIIRAGETPTEEAPTRGFTREHVDLLIKVAEEDDDALRQGVFDTLMAAAKWSFADDLAYMYEKLIKLPVAELGSKAVSLYKGFADAAISRASVQERIIVKMAQQRRDKAAQSGAEESKGASEQLQMPAPPSTLPWDDVKTWWTVRELWDMATHPAKYSLSPETEQQAIDAIVDLVKSYDRYRYMAIVLDKTFENISKNESVFSSIKLAQALLKAIPIYTAELPFDNCLEGSVNRVNSVYGVKALLLNELKAYSGDTTHSPQVKRAQLQTRLTFLLHVLQNSELTLDIEDVKSLWSCFIRPGGAEEDYDAFFSWLFAARFKAETATDTSNATRLFPDNLISATFADLFCNEATFPVANVTREGFKAFDMFLRATNAVAGKISAWDSDAYVVTDPNLIGLDTLWNIVLQQQSRDVAKDAVTALIHLYVSLKLAPPAGLTSEEAKVAVANEKQQLWRGFVTRCMEKIMHALAAYSDDKSQVRALAKVLRLLSTFLQAVEDSGRTDGLDKEMLVDGDIVVLLQEGPVHPAPFGNEAVIDAFIRNEAQKPALQRLRVRVRPQLETVAALRDRLADAFSVEGTRIRLNHLSQRDNYLSVKFDHVSITEARLEYGVSGEVLASAAPDTEDHVSQTRAQRIENQLRRRLELQGIADEDIEKEIERVTAVEQLESTATMAPRRLLSEKQEYFDALFALLSVHNPGIVSDAWNLLQSLPVSAKVEEDIHTLQGLVTGTSTAKPDWNSTLDATAPLKLLYSLQIITKLLDEIVQQNPDGASLADVKSSWGQAFVRGGGLEHVCKLFLTVDWNDYLSPGVNKLMKECARLLLCTLARFIGGGTSLRSFTDNGALVFQVDRPSVLKKAVSLLSYAATCHVPRDHATSALLAAAEQDTSGMPTSLVNTKTETSEKKKSKFDFDDDGWGLGHMFSIGEDDDLFEPTKTDSAQADSQETALPTEHHIVTEALALISGCLVGAHDVLDLSTGAARTEEAEDLQQEAIKALHSVSGISGSLFLSLVAPASEVTRKGVSTVLIALTKVPVADESFANFLFRELFALIDKAYAFPDTCTEYFAVLTAAASSATKLVPAADQAVKRMASILKQHPVVEIGSETRDIADIVLQGLLRSTKAIVAGRTEIKGFAGTDKDGCGLVDEVFEKVLFASPSDASNEKTPSLLGGRLPKGKQAATRKAAFELLVELANNCLPNAIRLCELLLPHHDAEAAAALATLPGQTAVLARSTSGSKQAEEEDEAKPKNKYGGISSTDVMGKDAAEAEKSSNKMSGRGQTLVASRSSTGYVGLRNLGCICYMNATMQQFFMNPAFRRGVLSWKETATSKEDLDNSLMYQMQRQFAHLQESDKQYYNPKGLCNAIKDWEGNPTDVTEQKDVPEFLTKLFSDMETQCQGTALASLPKDVFGGLTMQELIADDPRGGGRKRLYATRDDMYYFLQVRVKNHKTLSDALAELVAGESVDYKWTLPEDAQAAGGAFGSESGAKDEKKKDEVTVKTTKRVSIKSVGDHLMLHLNRFEFNYETMQQEKLNDRFEFPRVLDMWPYTVYGRSDAVAEAEVDETASHCDRDQKNYVFELVGVVIHMGTAIGGHYYSYIRERGDAEQGQDRWFEFNDTLVSPWEGTDKAFERDCFGGVDSYTTTYYGTKHVTERVKSANAFVLYYDRVKRSPSKPEQSVATSAAGTKVPESLAGGAAATSDATVSSVLSLIPSDAQAVFSQHFEKIGGVGSEKARIAVRAPVPTDLLSQIQQENLENRRLRTIYDLEYFAFMQQIVKATANITSPTAAPFDGAAPSTIAAVPYPWEGIHNTEDAMRLGGPAMVAFRLAVAFMLNTLTDSNQTATTPVWLGFIRQLIANNEVAPAWLLQKFISDPADLKRMLYQDTSIAAESMRTISSALGQICSERIWASEVAAKPTSAADVPAASRSAFIGQPGKLVETFVRVLLQQLPRLHIHWRRFGAFFQLLNGLANIDGVRQMLLDDGAIGKLIDFALAGDSPHPELNDVALMESIRLGLAVKKDEFGRCIPTESRTMGDAYANPVYDDIFHLLRNLITSCKPPSNLDGSKYGQQPQASLSDIDTDLVTCRQFIAAVIPQCNRYTNAKLYAPLITHVYWGASPDSAVVEKRADFGLKNLMHTTAAIIKRGIVVSEWDEQRSYFHFAKVVCDISGDSADDSLQKARIGVILPAIITGLREQCNFFRATELGIENLTRLAKRRPLVQQWLAENTEAWAWCNIWYRKYERCPTGAGAEMRLMKRQQYSYYYQQNNQAMRDACTIHNINALLAGKEPEFDFYDSDDEPTDCVGKPVVVVLQNGRSIKARIAEYDATRNDHVIQFEDGTTRHHNLTDHKIISTRFEYSDTFKQFIDEVAAAEAEEEEEADAPAAERKEDAAPLQRNISEDSSNSMDQHWEHETPTDGEDDDDDDDDSEEGRAAVERLAMEMAAMDRMEEQELMGQLGELDDQPLRRENSGNSSMDMDDTKMD